MVRRRASRVGRAAVALLALAALAATAAGAGGGGTIATFAGGFGQGDGLKVAQRPAALAASGTTLYVADTAWGVVRALDTTTDRETVAASGFSRPSGLAVDGAGDLYVADAHGVTRIDRSGARSGVSDLAAVSGLAADGSGGLYASDEQGGRVVRIAASGAVATVASVPQPTGLAVAADGSVLVVASGEQRVLRIRPSGTVDTFAGGGTATGEGIPATAAQLGFSEPASGCSRFGCAVPAFAGGALARGPDGTVFVAESAAGRIRAVDPSGTIATVAEPLARRSLTAVAVVGRDVWFAAGDRVGRVTRPGRVDYYAGTGEATGGGDGGSALDAQLRPAAVAVDAGGDVYVAAGDRVRKIDASGRIDTLSAGTPGAARTDPGFFEPVTLAVRGTSVYATDMQRGVVVAIEQGGARRTVARNLRDVSALAADARGRLYAVTGGLVREIDRSGRVSTLLRPTPALARSGFGNPSALAAGPAGDLYVSANSAIWRLDRRGRLTRIAGTPGDPGFGGDGGPATRARLLGTALAVDGAGDVYVADAGTARVRMIDTRGRIVTVAGDGTTGFGGDGGPAADAQLDEPCALAVDAHRHLYVAEGGDTGSPLAGRIRVVAFP